VKEHLEHLCEAHGHGHMCFVIEVSDLSLKRFMLYTFASFMPIQGTGRVFLPMEIETISVSKLQNSGLDIRPTSQEQKEKIWWMD